MADKVDISALSGIDLTQLSQLTPNDAAKEFSGTDLNFNTETGQLETVGEGVKKSFPVQQEVDWIDFIRKMDSSGDHFVDLTETKAALEKSGSKADPEQFLNSIGRLVKTRYAPLAKNLQALTGEMDFQFFSSVLKEYNQGILENDQLLARGVQPIQAPQKFILNIPGSLYALYHAWHGLTGVGSKPDETYFYFDKVATNAAKNRFDERGQAIGQLEKVIAEGVKAGEDWALKLDINTALGKLDEKSRKVLQSDLPTQTLFQIYSIPDDKQRTQKLLDFAKAELSSFAGFGGGNTSALNGWNITGKHNNLRFARGVLHALATKKISDDQEFNKRIREEAKGLLSSMRGDGGGFGNFASVAFQRIVSVNGLLFKPAPLRDWGEEEKIGGFGQGLVTFLSLYGGYKGIQGAKDVLKLKPFTKGLGGMGEVWSAWREGASWKNLGLGGMGKAGEVAKAAEAGKELNWFGRVLDRVGSKIAKPIKSAVFGKFEELPAATQAGLKMVCKTGSKGMEVLTDAVIVLGITQYVYDGTEAPNNAFELDYEMDAKVLKSPNRK